MVNFYLKLPQRNERKLSTNPDKISSEALCTLSQTGAEVKCRQSYHINEGQHLLSSREVRETKLAWAAH